MSTRKDSWICGYAKNLKPCHEPAMWIVEANGLQIGACNRHKEEIKASFIPEIHVWSVEFVNAERGLK